MSKLNGARQIASLTIINDLLKTVGTGYTGIADEKLAVIATGGKVANSATTASVDKANNAIVTRDATGKIKIGESNPLYIDGVLSAANGGTGLDNGTGTMKFAGNLEFTGANSIVVRSTGGTDVTLPTSGTLATLADLDAIVTGLDVKKSCLYATKAPLDATYNALVNGATPPMSLTANGNGAITVDGQFPGIGARILVKDQANSMDNGIYFVGIVGDGTHPFRLTRTTDADNTPKNEVSGGMFTFIEGGSQANLGYVQMTPGDIVFGTNPIVFSQFSGAGQITAGMGLSKNGNTLYISDTGIAAGTYNSVTVNAQGQVTTAHNWTTISEAGMHGSLTDITDVTALASELNVLHSSSVSNGDLVKLHALTATAAEMNVLHAANATTSDLNKLHDITISATTINDLATKTALSTTTSGSAGALMVGVTTNGLLVETNVQSALVGLQTRINAITTANGAMVDYEDLTPTVSQGMTLMTCTAGYSAAAGVHAHLKVWLNGALQRGGVDYNETVPANGTFTFVVPLDSTDEVIVSYR